MPSVKPVNFWLAQLLCLVICELVSFAVVGSTIVKSSRHQNYSGQRTIRMLADGREIVGERTGPQHERALRMNEPSE
jgi:hypothetical protein